MKLNRIAFWLAVGAGLMDFSTGLGLVALPVFTLSAMRVAAPASPEGLLFLRFVGAFVAAVGAMYLWGAAGPRARLRTVLGVSVFPRLGAGSFTAWAVLTGALPAGWIMVSATDLALVVVQLWLLSRGACRDE